MAASFFPSSIISFAFVDKHFGGNIAVHHLANGFVMLVDGFFAPDAFFCHQRWVGGNAIQYAQFMLLLLSAPGLPYQ
jgi:hypothetical protein